MLRLLRCKKKEFWVLTGSKRFGVVWILERRGLWAPCQGQRWRPGGGQRLTQGLGLAQQAQQGRRCAGEGLAAPAATTAAAGSNREGALFAPLPAASSLPAAASYSLYGQYGRVAAQ